MIVMQHVYFVPSVEHCVCLWCVRYVSIGDYMISMGCVVSVCSLTSNNALHSFCRVLRWVWAFC